MKILVFIIAGLLFFSGTSSHQGIPSGYDLSLRVFASTNNIKSLSYTMEKSERINGKLIHQTSFVKLNRKPFKVYTRQEHPKKGLEVLYSHGENDNKAWINPAGFPWVNLKLDPYGSTMRKDQHHTILNSGYDHVISILEHLYEKHGKKSSQQMTQNKGSVSKNGVACWLVEYNNSDFNFEIYTVRSGETILTIADRNKLSEHMIMEINPEISDYSGVVEGQKIKLPSDYSPKLILTIEKERMIPLIMEIYDGKGLYERYEYSNIMLNPALAPAEFTLAYEEYSF